MPFLLLNQQHQSNEGKHTPTNNNIWSTKNKVWDLVTEYHNGLMVHALLSVTLIFKKN